MVVKLTIFKKSILKCGKLFRSTYFFKGVLAGRVSIPQYYIGKNCSTCYFINFLAEKFKNLTFIKKFNLMDKFNGKIPMHWQNFLRRFDFFQFLVYRLLFITPRVVPFPLPFISSPNGFERPVPPFYRAYAYTRPLFPNDLLGNILNTVMEYPGISIGIAASVAVLPMIVPSLTLQSSKELYFKSIDFFSELANHIPSLSNARFYSPLYEFFSSGNAGAFFISENSEGVVRVGVTILSISF